MSKPHYRVTQVSGVRIESINPLPFGMLMFQGHRVPVRNKILQFEVRIKYTVYFVERSESSRVLRHRVEALDELDVIKCMTPERMRRVLGLALIRRYAVHSIGDIPMYAVTGEKL